MFYKSVTKKSTIITIKYLYIITSFTILSFALGVGRVQSANLSFTPGSFMECNNFVVNNNTDYEGPTLVVVGFMDNIFPGPSPVHFTLIDPEGITTFTAYNIVAIYISFIYTI